MKLKWETTWTGGLHQLSGLPHLPGVPHLHVNRPLLYLRYLFAQVPWALINFWTLRVALVGLLRSPFFIRKSNISKPDSLLLRCLQNISFCLCLFYFRPFTLGVNDGVYSHLVTKKSTRHHVIFTLFTCLGLISSSSPNISFSIVIDTLHRTSHI